MASAISPSWLHGSMMPTLDGYAHATTWVGFSNQEGKSRQSKKPQIGADVLACAPRMATGLMERSMKRTAQIALATALFMGGATIAMAQNGPPNARWRPNYYYAYYNYAGPCHGRVYNLAPYYWPGDYPGAPAYRYLACAGVTIQAPTNTGATGIGASRQPKTNAGC